MGTSIHYENDLTRSDFAFSFEFIFYIVFLDIHKESSNHLASRDETNNKNQAKGKFFRLYMILINLSNL